MARTGEAVERLGGSQRKLRGGGGRPPGARAGGEKITRPLRAEGGCPWDRAQDIRPLRPYLVEETYEVLDEMDRVGEGGPWWGPCAGLVDLVLQMAVHALLE